MKPAELFDQKVASLNDWRGELQQKLRTIIEATNPDLKLEWKWDTAVWTRDGLVCAVSAFKDHVKLNFFKGVQLKDPQGLINAGLNSKGHRAIDFSEGDKLSETALKDLIQEAVALNAKK